MSESFRPVRDIQAAPSRVRDIAQSGNPVFKGFLAMMSVIVLAVSGLGYYSVGRLGGKLAASDLVLGGKDFDGADGALDILVVGSDSRTDAQGNPLSDAELRRLNAGEADGELNTDTIMVVRVPNDGSRATAVSIPRDTYIHDEKMGNTKINGVYGQYASEKREELVESGEKEGKELEEKVAQAGQQGLIDAVADLTGVEVDHYAQVGLLGFVLLTDAVGGVDVCLNQEVDEPMSGAKFPAGRSTLDGAQALAFVRQRHDLPRGDLDRIVRQQVFMASLVNEVLSAGTLSNPNKLRELSNAVERSVNVDSGWDIMSLATQMSDLAAGNVNFLTIPVTSVNGVGDYGESIVTVDVNQVHTFMDELAKQQEEAANGDAEGEGDGPGKADPVLNGASISVLNIGEDATNASGVNALLQDNGVTSAGVSDAMPGIYEESQVVASSEDDPAAKALAKMLGDLPITVSQSLEPGSVVAVIGSDYSGPQSDAPVAEEAVDEEVSPSDTVGTPGEDFGAAEVAPEINAGGEGPRCVN